ncbi:MAG: alpha/beta hydrolase [Desulfamplus sp.]|nr:alpha/beta hydrolase [Desulfamplus sp.]
MISIFLMFLLLSWTDARAGKSHIIYDYPFVNPYEATVLGTPSLYRTDIPDKIRIKTFEMQLFEQRDIPEVFWYHDRFQYSLAWHKKKSPLIFVIAGTGSGYNAGTMVNLQKILFKAGFHVVAISSPTYPNFIVTASETMVPGYIEQDARDIYRVMEMARDQITVEMGEKVRISDFYLMGYSLGAAQSAFVAIIDDEMKSFDFKKILMINPPVNLFSSVSILDDLLDENIPGGLANFNSFFYSVFDQFADYYKNNKVNFSDPDAIYEMYKSRPVKETDLAALIGVSFRLSSGSMIFTSDVMTRSSYIVPGNKELTYFTSLTDYGIVTFHTSFTDYFQEYFYPFFKEREPGLTREKLKYITSLESIEDYLINQERIFLITNSDDIILEHRDIDFFRRVFRERAKIYPNGGHCGNMEYIHNVDQMMEFLKN